MRFPYGQVRHLVRVVAIGQAVAVVLMTNGAPPGGIGRGKIKFLTDGNDIGYIKGKKYLVSYGSSSYNLCGYDVYKISGGKAKSVCSYSYDEGVYKKNNKKIGEKAFINFQKTVKLGLGKTFTISK